MNMTIVRRPTPFGELISLRQAMDRLFEDGYVRPSGPMAGSTTTIPLDVRATAEALVIEAPMAGFRPEDVDITVEDGTLAIRAETSSDRDESEGDYLVREIRRGSIRRAVRLPTGLEADKATADFTNGVLTLRIPKAEATKPRQIRITTSSDGSSDRDADATAPAVEAGEGA
jgi:HSP20 family protein